jgi:choline dehydrogenase-like flavoprotein
MDHHNADFKRQNPTGDDVMQANFSGPDWKEKWEAILDGIEKFDYIVVGSGFTGYSFAEKIFALDKAAKILMLERGPFFLADHFQNSHMSFKVVIGGRSETFPFTVTEATKKSPGVGFMHGSCPFVGGRSSYWSGWCPKPDLDVCDTWPQAMKDIMNADGFWEDVERVMNIKTAD